MFEHDFLNLKSFDTLTDKEHSFHSFLLTIKQDKNDVPFRYESDYWFKGRPVVFTVSGFGGYFNSDNKWTLFVAYRSNDPKHTIQHTWSWDSDKELSYNHRIFQFIN